MIKILPFKMVAHVSAELCLFGTSSDVMFMIVVFDFPRYLTTSNWNWIQDEQSGHFWSKKFVYRHGSACLVSVARIAIGAKFSSFCHGIGQ